MVKWISDSASTLSPLEISILCTLPTKKRMLCSVMSMTPRSELRAERERKVGWKGHMEGPATTASGVSAKRAWAAPTSHNPTLPTTPFRTHNTWSALGKFRLDQFPATARASWGGGGRVQVRGVGLVVAVPGVWGPQVKKSRLQPIRAVGEGRQPMVAVGGHHQQNLPPVKVNGVPSRRHRIPQGRPRLHRHLVVL